MNYFIDPLVLSLRTFCVSLIPQDHALAIEIHNLPNMSQVEP